MSEEATLPAPGMTILAAAFGNGSGCQIVSKERAKEAIEDKNRLLWMHVIVHDKEQGREYLGSDLGFHELAVEDALSVDERPAVQQFDSELFLVLPAVVEGSEAEEFVEIAFFVRDTGLVTVSLAPAKVVDDTFARWTRRPEVTPTVVELVHSLADAIVDSYFPVVDAIEDRIDDMTDIVLQGRRGHIEPILQMRQRLLNVRRQLGPARDVLNSLLRRDVALVTPAMRPYFQDVFDHILRILELAELNRETLASLVDIHLSSVSNALNEVMKKMTVIATVLMTMSLIAGIYGMNFAHMPELHWRTGYPFALMLMILSAALVLYLFRRKRWI